MNDTGFIARRYLFAKKHISLISTLTLISIVGVTIGTAMLIVVLSVFNGFFDVIKGLLLSYDPDVRIESAEGKTFTFSEQQFQEIRDIPEVQIVSPYAGGKCLLAQRGEEHQVVEVRGIHKETFFQLNDLKNSITSGIFDLGVKSRQPGMLIGEQLMHQLGLEVGEEAVLMSASGMKKALTQFSGPHAYRFDVRGAYSLQTIMQGATVFIDLRAAQRLFGYRNSYTGIDLKLKDNTKAEQVKEKLAGLLGSNFKISTWYDLQRPLYDVMYLEKWGAYLILMIIVLVAVLNIVGSLTMIVIQKNRDIGVLITLGYTRKAIKRIFIKQGLYVGLIGCGIGGTLGLLLSWLQKQYGLIKLSSAFIIDAYPVSVSPTDVAIILAGSLLLCIAASWYPATRASAVQPADAIRYE